ncbi:unnamed protein product [Lepidochelys kempii]
MVALFCVIVLSLYTLESLVQPRIIEIHIFPATPRPPCFFFLLLLLKAGTFPTSKWGTVSCIHVQHSSVRAQLCRPASGKMGVHCPSISMERLAKASLSSPAILGCSTSWVETRQR